VGDGYLFRLLLGRCQWKGKLTEKEKNRQRGSLLEGGEKTRAGPLWAERGTDAEGPDLSRRGDGWWVGRGGVGAGYELDNSGSCRKGPFFRLEKGTREALAGSVGGKGLYLS